jgi:hypothetical protein
MPDYLVQLRGRLAELGCPTARRERMVQEIADHREDLIRAASPEDPTPPGMRAEAALGQPSELADNLMATFRQSTWCGRHAWAVFAVLPLLFPVFWGVVLALEFCFFYGLEFGWDWQRLHDEFCFPGMFQLGVMTVTAAVHVAIGVATWLFCWLAYRSGVSRAWTIIACLICAAYALCLSASIGHDVQPGHYTLNVGIHFNYRQPWSGLAWSQAAVPLGLAAIARVRQQRRIQAARSRCPEIQPAIKS